eukprot:5157461-Prymnesium_polylepis.1
MSDCKRQSSSAYSCMSSQTGDAFTPEGHAKKTTTLVSARHRRDRTGPQWPVRRRQTAGPVASRSRVDRLDSCDAGGPVAPVVGLRAQCTATGRSGETESDLITEM